MSSIGLSAKLRVCLVMLAISFASAWADIGYTDENGVEHVKLDGEYTEFTGDMETTDLPGGWYAVTSSVTYKRITSDEDLYFILADGATLSLQNTSENNLVARNIFVYGQKLQTGTISIKSYRANGIRVERNITIAGGRIYVSSDNSYDPSYGISCRNITITGGIVNTNVSSFALSVSNNVTITGGSVTALSGNNSTLGIEADNLYISGGSVVARGSNAGLYVRNNAVISGGYVNPLGHEAIAVFGKLEITGGELVMNNQSYGYGDHAIGISVQHLMISGGKIKAVGIGGDKGVYVGVDMVLGYTKPSDYLVAIGGYQIGRDNDKTFSIVDGQAFYDENGIIYTGVLSDKEMVAIKGKTLRPYKPGIVFTEDADGKMHAEIDAESDVAVVLSAAKAMEVDAIDFNRELTPNVPATVVLPFTLPEGTTVNADFYQLTAVQQVGYSWKATMSYIGDGKLPETNTPYVVILHEGYNKLEFNLNGQKAVVQSGAIKNVVTDDGNWSFNGVYAYKEWEKGDKELGLAYAFAGRDEKGVSKGEFAKVGEGAYANAMRAYLRKKDNSVQLVGPQNRPVMNEPVANYSMEFVPESIETEFVKNQSGTTKFVSRMNATIGNYKMSRSYDLKGRNVQGKVKAKGTYYGKRN